MSNDRIINEMVEIKNQLLNKEIPERYPDEITDSYCDFSITQSLIENNMERFQLISISSFVLISKSWIRPLSKWIGKRRCLEIMAGTGMLSKALKDENIDIIATDNYTWGKETAGDVFSEWFTKPYLWTEVEKLDAISAIKKYGKQVDIVICSWPYMDDNLYDALIKLRKINPKAILLYIGEDWGGCTASDNFFETATYIDDKEIYKINKKFQSWAYIHDRIKLYK